MKAIVIGLGTMGRNHARVLGALGHEVATVDIDPDAGADHATLEDALPADVACIATPPGLLASYTARALTHGLDVLVEKPMAMTEDEAASLCKLALSSGRRLVVGYTERCNPALQVMREKLELVGEVQHVTARRVGPSPGRPLADVVLDLGTHELDALRFLGFEPELDHVAGDERHAVLSLSAAGATASIEVSHLHPRRARTLTVVGENGMLAMDYHSQEVEFVERDSVLPLRPEKAEPLREQWSRFVSDVSGASAPGASPLVSPAEGRDTLALALRASRTVVAPRVRVRQRARLGFSPRLKLPASKKSDAA